jgi:hypothetical protein
LLRAVKKTKTNISERAKAHGPRAHDDRPSTQTAYQNEKVRYTIQSIFECLAPSGKSWGLAAAEEPDSNAFSSGPSGTSPLSVSGFSSLLVAAGLERPVSAERRQAMVNGMAEQIAKKGEGGVKLDAGLLNGITKPYHVTAERDNDNSG